jgi:hypothetical protein
MLTGLTLPDPMHTEPSSALDKVPLPPRLRAVLRGALDVRDRRHHSAASMAEALRAAMQAIAVRQQQKQRAWWLAPAVGVLLLPTWFAARSVPPTITCPPTASPAQAIAAPPVAAPIIVEPPVLQAKIPIEPEPDARVEEDRIATAVDNRRPAPRPRFDLRAALAKCKPHPTTRLTVKYDPAGPLQINDDPPQGEMGRCVEDVLQRHPPHRAVTLTP